MACRLIILINMAACRIMVFSMMISVMLSSQPGLPQVTDQFIVVILFPSSGKNRDVAHGAVQIQIRAFIVSKIYIPAGSIDRRAPGNLEPVQIHVAQIKMEIQISCGHRVCFHRSQAAINRDCISG